MSLAPHECPLGEEKTVDWPVDSESSSWSTEVDSDSCAPPVWVFQRGGLHLLNSVLEEETAAKEAGLEAPHPGRLQQVLQRKVEDQC